MVECGWWSVDDGVGMVEVWSVFLDVLKTHKMNVLILIA